MLNKIISILCLPLALFTGFNAFMSLAFSGFSPGLQMDELMIISLFTLATILLLICMVSVWRNRLWSKILLLVISLSALGLQIFIGMFEGSSAFTFDLISIVFIVILILLVSLSLRRRTEV